MAVEVVQDTTWQGTAGPVPAVKESREEAIDCGAFPQSPNVPGNQVPAIKESHYGKESVWSVGSD